MHDSIDIGVFDKSGQLEYLEKQEVLSGQNKFTILVDKEPAQAGVDPLNKLIDKVSDDNVISTSEESVNPSQ